MQAEISVPRGRRRVLFPMSVGLMACSVILRFLEVDGAILHLRPYLDGPVRAGWSASMDEWLVGEGSQLRPFLFGGLVMVLFLLFEHLIRRVFRQPHESAALVAAAVVAIWPAQAAHMVVHGGAGLLLTGLVFAAGGYLLLSGHLLMPFVGALLCAAACGLHPAFMALVPAAALLAFAGRSSSRAFPVLGVLALASLACFFLAGCEWTSPLLHESLEQNRIRRALMVLVSAPIYAFESAVRSLMPTGYEVLGGHLPLYAGLAIWGMIAGVCAMTVGLARTAWTLLACTSAAGAALLMPHYVPGDRLMALWPLYPAAGLVALFLGVCRGGPMRDVFLGVAVGLFAVAGILSWQRGPGTPVGNILATRTLAFQIPRREVSPDVTMPAPDLEPDPVRLILAAFDVADRTGNPADPVVFTFADATNLDHFPDFVIDRPGLERLRRSLSQVTGAMPLDAKESERQLFEEWLPAAEEVVLLLSRETQGPDPDIWYDRVMMQYMEHVPDFMQIVATESRHPRVTQWGHRLVRLSSSLADMAFHLGDVSNLVPVLETSWALTRNPRTAAMLVLGLTDVGRFDEARTFLKEARPSVGPSDVLGAVMRGAEARMLHKEGQNREALDAVELAWNGLAIRGGARGDMVSQVASRQSIEYWLLVELLDLRHHLAREAGDGLEVQAEFDLDNALNAALAFGKRPLPALLFKGLLEARRGQKDAAIRMFQAMRKARPKGVLERDQRIALPRFRRRGLEALLELLPESAQGEREAIAAELSALQVY